MTGENSLLICDTDECSEPIALGFNGYCAGCALQRLRDGEALVTIKAKVSPKTATYLQEWADAVGCERPDVAGDSIEQYLEEWEGSDE